MGKVIAFGWYGGKFSHLDWLLPLLPKTTHYCEPFGGSAAVLLNREPSPVETYNDLDGDVVNFFRVLRDDHEALIEAIGLTPFSREEFRIATSQFSDDLTDLDALGVSLCEHGKSEQAWRRQPVMAGGHIAN